MVKTDERISLRGLQDYILSGDETTGYKMNVVGEVCTSKDNVVEFISNNTSTTHTLGQISKKISFSNDGNTSITFTINSVAITLLTDEVFDGEFEDFTEIIVVNVGLADYRIVIFG